MGVRLIRQNSNTPTVTNIDDARMVRYAYGGYDGYVKNRGTECGYSVNGVNFRITSGVLSLQGWESEVDSNGWSTTVDSIAQKRYFSVYYEVNGAAGTAEIKSIYDTAGYPTIDPGDDLTRTTNGTARLLLYTFTSTNGIIADVAKKVDAIIYNMEAVNSLRQGLTDGTISVKNAENSKNINNLNLTQDEKGRLRIGEFIIPQKKLIWSGQASIGSNTKIFTDTKSLLYRTFEIYTNHNNYFKVMFRKENINQKCSFLMELRPDETAGDFGFRSTILSISLNTVNLNWDSMYASKEYLSSSAIVEILNIYEVFE